MSARGCGVAGGGAGRGGPLIAAPLPRRRHVWRTYSLTFGGEKLADDRKKLRE